MDLVGPLPTTKGGHKYLFTATDYFTKWVEGFAIPNKSASEVAKCILKLVYTHGAPQRILTDQGREFVNEVSYSHPVNICCIYDHSGNKSS